MAAKAEETTVERPLLRKIEGTVTSAKTLKTIKVTVTYQVKHPKYGKYLNRRTTLHVHDEKGEAREGDRVQVAECRPISKTKHHRLLKVLTRGNAAVKAEEPSEIEA
jgi:small subunit ribosomal protein S17